MSIVAVRKYKEKIVIAGDRQTTGGDNKLVDSKDNLLTNPSKIWQHNDLAIGSVGYRTQTTLFQIFTRTRKPASASIESLMDFLVEFEDWCKKRESSFKIENHFLIIFEGKVFQTFGLHVQEVSEYNAVGSGMYLALGAMFKGSDPEEAIEVAKEFDLYCSGKTDKIEVEISAKIKSKEVNE